MAQSTSSVLDLLDLLDQALDGPARAEVSERLMSRPSPSESMRALRALMSSHSAELGAGHAELGRLVRGLDGRTRQDGFRVLHAWNHQTHEFTDDIVPVLMLDFYDRAGGSSPRPEITLRILIDYYYLHLLALAAMRVWDAGDPNSNLDRLTRLVEALQGSWGSGHHFVADAETLLIYALSQFHPEEHAYDRLIERVAELNDAHQLAFARVSAAVLGAHLRWGFWLMYGRDPIRMREDNVADYPWLLYSVLTLLRAYARLHGEGASPAERADVVEGLLLGLAADPWAFTGKARPAALDAYGPQYDEARGLLERHGTDLLAELEADRPRKDVYAPLSLHFNFPHNTLVAIVTLALLEGRPQSLPLNALFERYRDDFDGTETQEGLARTLMAFSRASPDRLGYQGAMLVAYDPLSGLRSHSVTVQTIRKSLA